jgi:hypothetical protein
VARAGANSVGDCSVQAHMSEKCEREVCCCALVIAVVETLNVWINFTKPDLFPFIQVVKWIVHGRLVFSGPKL